MRLDIRTLVCDRVAGLHVHVVRRYPHIPMSRADCSGSFDCTRAWTLERGQSKDEYGSDESSDGGFNTQSDDGGTHPPTNNPVILHPGAQDVYRCTYHQWSHHVNSEGFCNSK